MQQLICVSQQSKIIDSILKDAEIKKAVDNIEKHEIKIAYPLIIIAENLSVKAMSLEEIKKNLKLLEDPEIAKQVADALKKSISGETIKIAKLPTSVGLVLMALLAYLGPVFAQDPELKADFSHNLELKKVDLKDINEFKENAEETLNFIDELNEVIKDKTGKDIPGFSYTSIGGKKLTAKNKYEAEVLQQMVKIDNKMKRNVALGFMSSDTYQTRIDKMIKAFETGRPISL